MSRGRRRDTPAIVAMLVATGIQGWGPPADARPDNRVSLDLMYGYFQYDEPAMEETGHFYGPRLEWRHRYGPEGIFMVDGGLLKGATDYDGETWGGSPVETTTEDAIRWGAIRTGWDLEGLVPFWGLGWRQWNQEIEGVGGYRRSHTYVYVPFGIDIESTSRGSGWWWRLRLGYNHLLWGKVDSKLSDVAPSIQDATNELDGGQGYEVAFKMEHRGRDDAFGWTGTLYAKRWTINESETDTVYAGGTPMTVYEPENDTWMGGVRLGIAF